MKFGYLEKRRTQTHLTETVTPSEARDDRATSSKQSIVTGLKQKTKLSHRKQQKLESLGYQNQATQCKNRSIYPKLRYSLQMTLFFLVRVHSGFFERRNELNETEVP